MIVLDSMPPRRHQCPVCGAEPASVAQVDEGRVHTVNAMCAADNNHIWQTKWFEGSQ